MLDVKLIQIHGFQRSKTAGRYKKQRASPVTMLSVAVIKLFTNIKTCWHVCAQARRGLSCADADGEG